MRLRPYQQEAIRAVFERWREFSRLLAVLPTGTGKTVIFAHTAADEHRSNRRTLILAHREELIQQAADKLCQATGLGCAIERADETATDSLHMITVGSVQTLMRQARLDRFSRDWYDTIIVDEAHHALSPSYQGIFGYFAEARVLGVTATPDRGDRKNLGHFFQDLAFEYSLHQAIRDGYLCRIRAQTVPLAIELGGVRTTAGDFSEADLGSAVEPYLERIADEMAKVCRDRKTLVFLPLVRTSQKMRDALAARGFAAAHVDGNSPDRAEILADFGRGRYNVLCNSMLLTEGYDEPSIDCIVCLRPTKVRALYCQAVGRGTRLYPGKDHLLILDFLWHSEQHELCRPAHLVAKTAEIAGAMTAAIEGAAGNPDASADLLLCEEDAVSEAVRQREEALARRLKENARRQARTIDPVEFSLSLADEDLADYEPAFGWEMDLPTERQVAALTRFGIAADQVPNKGYASRLLDRIFARRRNNLASPRQVALLHRYGVPGAQALTFDEAKAAITALIGNSRRAVA